MSVHKSVLLKEVLDSLSLKKGAVFVDGTINGGGHSEALSKSLSGELTIIGIDLDKDALERARKRLEGNVSKIFLFEGSFRNMGGVVESLGVAEKVDGILLDLGLSSDQLELSLRGFSFQKDEPLLMTFSARGETMNAAFILNSFKEGELAKIIEEYGEEPAQKARKISRAIVEARLRGHIVSSKQLSELIKGLFPKQSKIHPATKTFQALRIYTNDEIGALKEGLKEGFRVLKRGGRMSVISFHSLEDREVKNFFKNKAEEGEAVLINKKPIAPTKEEVFKNPRSRSAKLRTIEKIK